MKGTAFGVLATALEKLVALGVALYLPRHHFGVEDYGRYTFILAHLNLFQVLGDAAVETVLVARLAAAGDDAPRLAGAGALTRGTMSLLCGLVGLAVLPWVSGDATVLAGACAWSAGLLVTACNPYRPLLRARLAMGRYVTVVAGQMTVALAAFLWVLRQDGGVPYIMLAIGAGNVAGFVLGRALAGARVTWRFDGRLSRELLNAAAPLAATTLVLIGAQQTMQVVLLRLGGPGAVGTYGGAQKMVEAINVLAQAVMLTTLPALATAAALDAGTAVVAARRTTAALLLVLSPIAAFVAGWPETALGLLFGPSMLAAAPTLRILSVVVVLNATGAVLSSLLVALGRQRVLVIATVVSALVTVAAGVWTVPAAGPVGLAAAIVGGMIAGQVTLLLLPSTTRATAAVWRGAAGPVLAGLAVVATAWTLRR